MEFCVKEESGWGRVLWLTGKNAQVGVALDFGIRIVHLSYPGCENLYYVQPADLSDGFITDGGWKLYGGHRLWMAPESDDSYYPDNDPVSYELFEDGVLITQQKDPVLGIQKFLRLSFLNDGSVRLEQGFKNVSDQVISGASWGVNTLDAGGKAYIRFTNQDKKGYVPHRVVSLWSDTNLHDPRLRFDRKGLTAQFLPLSDYLKIGLYCLDGNVVFENKGQRMVLTFDSEPLASYPDNGCNFELYMCSKFMELETMGVKSTLQPGESTNHTETWYLTKV